MGYEYFELTEPQKSIWNMTLISEKLNDTITSDVFFEGEVDLSCAQTAINCLYKSNQSLRTGFIEIDGSPHQYFHDNDSFKPGALRVLDFSCAEEYVAWASEYARAELKGKLSEISLVSLKDRYGFITKFSHLICDGTSIIMILADIAHYYENAVSGALIEHDERKYQSFIEREKSYYGGSGGYLRDKEFWRKRLIETDRVTQISTCADISFSAKRLSIDMDDELEEKLGQYCAETGISKFAVLFTCYAKCVAAHSQNSSVNVLCAVANRWGADEKLIPGMFVNTVPVFFNTEGDANETVADWLRRSSRDTFNTLKRYRYSYNRILQDYCDIHKTDTLLTDVSFSYQDFDEFDYQKYISKPFTTCWHFSASQTESLILHARKDPRESFKLHFDYREDKLSEWEISAFSKHFITLLASVLENGQSGMTDLEMVNINERRLILGEFNDTDAYYDESKTLVDLFEEQAERTPYNIALKYKDESMSYDALNKRANRLARRLRMLGVKPDDRVALISERGMEMIVGLLGILKAGGAYVPIDPGHPGERIRYMLNDSMPKAVLVHGFCTGDMGLPRIFGADIPLVDLDDEENYAEYEGNPPRVNRPEDLAYIIYTSGTTGKPKGVMIEHSGVVNFKKYFENNQKTDETDTVLQFANIAFDAHVSELLLSIFAGAKLLICDIDEMTDVKRFKEIYESEGVSVMLLPPHFLNRLEGVNPRIIISAGSEAIAESVMARSENTHYSNDYGPTEATVCAAHWAYTYGDDIPKSVPIGRPIENKKLYILDGMKLCGIGVPGELCIAGAGLARGYMNQPELTAEKFIENPYGEGRLYRSGDLARWLPDGNIEYLGRIDEQVKIRGFRIELGEIESVLRRQDGVKDAAVVVKEDAGDKYICAYVVPSVITDSCAEAIPGAGAGHDAGSVQRPAALSAADLSDLREALRAKLPDYMIPSYITMIPSLPLTRNGKLDRRALPEPTAMSDKAYAAPVTENEKIIVSVFEEILGKSPIGTDDSFFETGGHSLRAAMAVNAIEERTGVRIPLRDVFTYPTARQLAKEIEKAGKGVYLSIPKAEIKSYYPMSSAQKRLFVIDQIEGGGITYNMPALIETDDIDIKRLEAAVDKLVRRHEPLRTSFCMMEGEAVQVIGDEEDIKLEIEYSEYGGYESRHEGNYKDEARDASHVSGSIEQSVRGFVRSFDLGKAPLMRVKAIKRRNCEKSLILFDMHHIISDGMTMNIIINEFSKLYKGDELEPLKVQYKDYSEWMQKRDISSQEAYWKQVFAEEAPVLNLPIDYPRPKLQSSKGKRLGYTLGKEQREGIEKINKTAGTTSYMSLLAAFMILLGKYSRQDDIVVGSPVSGRTHKDTQTMAGMFVNTLAMRGRPESHKTYKGFLDEIKEVSINAYENQEYPFEELVEDVVTKRDLSRNPLFDVMFIMQNNEEAALSMGGTELKPRAIELNESKFEISLEISESDGGYHIEVEYCSDLFSEGSIERMMRHYERLIDSIIENPGLKIAELETASEDERTKILGEFNDTNAGYEKDKTLAVLFEEQAMRTPGNIALKYKEESMSYDELNRRANRLARRIRAFGIKPDDRVAIISERGMEMIVGILGIIKAGGAYVPIDPGYPGERIGYMLNDSMPKAVLVHGGDGGWFEIMTAA
ncbi:MAG: amino acid adenylation domain-containing protein, partial [Clostridiales Family XIII bacterium]|nr:amino acid adenylation domain-containing protein [Clostridiales Family XIII bacterium]